MAKRNLYERVADKLAAYESQTVDKLADAMRGGKAPPWSVHLTDQQLYDVYSRMSPQEAWARWETMEPGEQRKLARIMNQRQRGGT